LVELVIVITIIGIISGVIGFVLLGTVDAWTFKFNRADLLSDGRLAANRMVREIREIKDPTSVIMASPSQFRFANTGNIDITYAVSGSALNRTADGISNALAEDVTSLTFTYYDSGGGVIPSPVVSPGVTDIARVLIDIALTKNGENVYVESQSVPRNF